MLWFHNGATFSGTTLAGSYSFEGLVYRNAKTSFKDVMGDMGLESLSYAHLWKHLIEQMECVWIYAVQLN